MSFATLQVRLVAQGNRNTLDFSQTVPIQLNLGLLSGQLQSIFANDFTPNFEHRFRLTPTAGSALQRSTLALEGRSRP